MTTITNMLSLEVDLTKFTYTTKDVIKRDDNFSAVLIMSSDSAKFEYLTPPLDYSKNGETAPSIDEHIQNLG